MTGLSQGGTASRLMPSQFFKVMGVANHERLGLGEHVGQAGCFAQDAGQLGEYRAAGVGAVDPLVAALLALEQSHVGQLAQLARQGAGGQPLRRAISRPCKASSGPSSSRPSDSGRRKRDEWLDGRMV